MAKSEQQIREEVYEEFGNANACAKLFFELVREEQHLKELQNAYQEKKKKFQEWREEILENGGMAAEILLEATHVDLMSDAPLTADEVKSSGIRKRVSQEERTAASDEVIVELLSAKSFTRKMWEKLGNDKLNVDSGSASWNATWKTLQDSGRITCVNKKTLPHQYKVKK